MQPNATSSPEPSQKPEVAESDPRVQLATERTLLAWIRTGLALMAFGFVVARFALVIQSLGITTNPWLTLLSTVIGVVMIVMGVIVNTAAPLHYRRYFRRISGAAGKPFADWALVVFVAFALSIIGILLAIHLLLFELMQVHGGPIRPVGE